MSLFGVVDWAGGVAALLKVRDFKIYELLLSRHGLLLDDAWVEERSTGYIFVACMTTLLLHIWLLRFEYWLFDGLISPVELSRAIRRVLQRWVRHRLLRILLIRTSPVIHNQLRRSSVKLCAWPERFCTFLVALLRVLVGAVWTDVSVELVP